VADPKTFLSETEQTQVVQAIQEAEKRTSGEIRVHLDRTSGGNVNRKAVAVFRWLKMHKTDARNGVLIYLAVEDHEFAIIGDQGVNQVVPSGFWDTTRDAMQAAFKKGQFAEGLMAGIREAGEQLRLHFPYQSDDVNELPDDISFGDA
jgi:uncharacterized membrane protein